MTDQIIAGSTLENVSDCYELEGVIGRGGFSTVWAASSRETGDLVAVKQVEKTCDSPSSQVERLKLVQREVACLRAVRGSPHIVDLIGCYEDDHTVHIVFELLMGSELFDLISQHGYFEEDNARKILGAVVEAIAWCHDRNIAHRDIKPENLMITSTDEDLSDLKLLDFGLAIVINDDSCIEQAGSPGYVAPEIIRGVPYGKAVDIWSLGVTAYIIFVGYSPWDDSDSSTLSVPEQALQGLYSLDFPEWDSVSSLAKDFVRSCLELDPKKRITAQEARKHPFLTQKTTLEESQEIPIPHNLIEKIQSRTESPALTPSSLRVRYGKDDVRRLKSYPRISGSSKFLADLLLKRPATNAEEHHPKQSPREHRPKELTDNADDEVLNDSPSFPTTTPFAFKPNLFAKKPPPPPKASPRSNIEKTKRNVADEEASKIVLNEANSFHPVVLLESDSSSNHHVKSTVPTDPVSPKPKESKKIESQDVFVSSDSQSGRREKEALVVEEKEKEEKEKLEKSGDDIDQLIKHKPDEKVMEPQQRHAVVQNKFQGQGNRLIADAVTLEVDDDPCVCIIS